jgi:hypothetical protein
LRIFNAHQIFHLHILLSNSVNFKKNEKVYNPEKSEVLKALQESDNEPEPGKNHDGDDISGAQFKVVDDDNNQIDQIDDDFERYSHFYQLALILSQLNRHPINDENGNLFINDKLID